jgi:MFS family permease
MVALALLGVGWNFMFVGGTTLLTTAYAPEERVRVQATHDFIVFGSVACTALTSGAVQATQGWEALNLTVVPPVLIAFAVVGWHLAARSRVARAAPIFVLKEAGVLHCRIRLRCGPARHRRPAAR